MTATPVPTDAAELTPVTLPAATFDALVEQLDRPARVLPKLAALASCAPFERR